MDKWKVVFGSIVFLGAVGVVLACLFMGKAEQGEKLVLILLGAAGSIAGMIGLGVKKKKGPRDGKSEIARVRVP